MKRRHHLLPVSAAMLALGLTACTAAAASGGASTSHSATGSGTAAALAATTTVAVQDRGAPLALAGHDLDGGRVTLASYRDRVVVLNVWGSWCGPCRAEAKGLEAVFEANRGKGVRFVGVDVRDLSRDPGRAFARTAGLGYPSLYDPDGSLLLSLPPGTVNPQAIPSTLILDRHGRVAVRALQPLTGAQLQSLLAPVLGEPA